MLCAPFSTTASLNTQRLVFSLGSNTPFSCVRVSPQVYLSPDFVFAAEAGVTFLMDSFNSSLLVMEAAHQTAFISRLDKSISGWI